MENKKSGIMKKESNLNAIAMLRYQLQRYRTMGNGTMCQLLNLKIQKMLEENGCTAKH